MNEPKPADLGSDVETVGRRATLRGWSGLKSDCSDALVRGGKDMRVSIAIIANGLVSLVATGCAFVPALEDATGTSDSPLLVADIVDRVKCELAFAFADKLDPRRGEFIWLQNWTVKADLTLQANEQGGISLRNASIRSGRPRIRTFYVAHSTVRLTVQVCDPRQLLLDHVNN